MAAFVAVLALLVATGCRRGPAEPPLPDTDAPLGALLRPTLAGPPLDFEALAGKLVIVNVWSPGCAPCAQEAPGLQQLADELAPRGVALVTVMLEGTPAEGQAFVSRVGLRAPVVIGDEVVAAHLRVVAYPWTVIVGRDGKPRKALRGSRDKDQLRAVLDRYL